MRWKRLFALPLAKAGLGRGPDFLIIGAQKAGTTSLYHYLRCHKMTAASRPKEIRFFNSEENCSKGVGWYHSHYPIFASRKKVRYEASPGYLYFPGCAQRIHDYNRCLKIIVLLRNPVDRAFSAWNMYRNYRGHHRYDHVAEQRDFLEAVTEEVSVITAGEENASDLQIVNPGYVRRGLYREQLERYFSLFPRDRILIIDTLRLMQTPSDVLDEVCSFVGIDQKAWKNLQLKTHNAGHYRDEMSGCARSFLTDFYRPYNEQLFSLLGYRLNWD